MGLGTGYLIYGPQELRGYPKRSKEVDWPTGLWGIALPGFLQFFTGAHDDPVGGLCIGLTGVYVSDVFATVKADLPPRSSGASPSDPSASSTSGRACGSSI